MSSPIRGRPPRLRPGVLALGVPVLVAAALRAHGLAWGLPDLSEEATPFFQAWQMWGWESGLRPDPDPAFYRYPSLTFYLQFLAQALLVAKAWLGGGIDAVRDLPVRFLADRTPFLLTARAVSALLGVGAVAGTAALGRRVGGNAVGLVAGLLLAVSAAHVGHSQLIEVDAGLVCFAAWALWACVRTADAPGWRSSVTAGALVGLATSAKYSGAFLVAALVAGHVPARPAGEERRWGRAAARLAAAAAVAIAVFAATSPFVLLRLDAARAAVGAEREHMLMGHFGQGDVPAWLFYLRQLAGPVLGWPLAVAAAAGLVVAAGVRRRRWAIVLAAFVVAYAAAVGSFAMRTERYLLPLLPPLVVLAAGLLDEVPRRARLPAAVLGALVLAAPNLAALPRLYERVRPGTRTLAREWIEARCPEGSFLVLEAWGPYVLEPEDLWRLSRTMRARFLELRPRPIYAVQNIPTYQVMPEMTEAFYDLSLYADADWVVLSSDVGDRYRAEPERFPAQLAFYDRLDRRAAKAAEFVPDGNAGPRLTVYRLPRDAPFARRRAVAGPQSLRPDRRRPAQGEAAFYKNLGVNYETFGFIDAALAAYGRAAAVGDFARDTLEGIAAGTARCLLASGDRPGALRALRAAADACPYPEERARILAARERIAAESR